MELKILIDGITNFVDNSQLNTVNEIGLNRIFDYPIIGVADAKDPMFFRLQNPDVIGPHHLLPSDWLYNAKSVISYFLPFSNEVRQANSEHGLPAIEWVYARIEGEVFNNALRNYIVDIVNMESFQSLLEKEEIFAKVIEFFPYPIQIFSLDGTARMINKARWR